MKDEIQKVTLGTNEALRVTADGEFIWHPEADAMIEEGDFTSSPAMRHILRALRKALAAPVQEPVATVTSESGNPDVAMSWWHEPPLPVGTKFYTTPPAAQRQWVGLTDEEAFQICVDCGCLSEDWLTLLDAIEAKLKEKNT